MSFSPLPREICDQHLVVLGKTGSGKSSALRFIVEKLLKQGKRLCIVDPKGDWWGLKSSADGKSAGFPVISFGDFKEQKASDVPINQHSGRHIAELVTSGNRPCIIGFRGWMPAHMVQFWIDFASGIFNANSGELYIVGDEFHNFAPKGKIMDPQAGKCLHWSNRLMSEGRGLGIVCLIASQRPQKVHNDTLTSCETLVAMRVIHAADRSAIEDWIEGCGDMEQGKEVLNSLAQMPRGEAYVWSPEIGFGPKRLAIPFFETFDSFAPPQTQKKISASGWADVDLVAVKEKLATVIEDAKANDPAELKKEIADLKRKLHTAESKKPEAAKAPEPVKVEVPILSNAALKLLELNTEKLTDVLKELERCKDQMHQCQSSYNQLCHAIESANQKRPQVSPRLAPIARPRTAADRIVAQRESNGTLSGGKLELMKGIAMYPHGVTKETLKTLTGYRSTSVHEYTRQLVVDGYATGERGTFAPTDAGINALGKDYEPLPTGDDLIAHWQSKLSGGEKTIFDFIVGSYPATVTKQTIQDATGYKQTSVHEFTRLLKSRRCIQDDRGQITLADEMT